MIRVQKWISECGFLSRRAAENALLEGRIKLNGAVLSKLGALIDPEKDEVYLDGKKVEKKSPLTTFLFYKPKKVVSTKSDPEGRKTVMDFFPDHPYLNPCGRLDYDSEGLMVMTNDGTLHQKLTHPKFEVHKTYFIQTKKPLSSSDQKKLLEGVLLEDGAAKALSLIEGEFESTKGYFIKLGMGRNRIIRRMIAEIQNEVQRLVRTEMGPYKLEQLQGLSRTKI